MEDTIVVDTDILVDLLRNNSNIIDWFNKNENNFVFATTIINIFELYVGAYKSQNKEKVLKDIDDIIKRFVILDLTIPCSEVAGKQRANLEKNGISIESRDILIGSIAVSNNLPLKTNNKKHFSRIEGLKLI